MSQIPQKPADAQWNDEQWEAIYRKDTDLLISAGAGSGKTAVLVERIIQKVLRDGVSVDELLVLTFTEAAAAEMKQRVRSRLEKEMIEQPDHPVIAKQLTKVSQANISTFHSFCNKLIKRYYYLLQIDPIFKIADDIEVSMIQDDVIEAIFNELSESEEASFELLAACFNNDRHDEELKTMIIKIYELARSNPNMFDWLKSLDALYEWDEVDLSSWAYFNEMIAPVKLALKDAKALLDEAYELARLAEMSGTVHKYVSDGYALDVAIHERLIETLNGSYEDIRQAFAFVKFETFPRFNKNLYDREQHDLSKDKRDAYKELVSGLQKKYFLYSTDTHRQHFAKSKELVQALVSLISRFHDDFSAMKLEKQVLDFSDLEWNTLRLLVQDDKPTDVAIEIAQSLKEIMVDEYQDTNSMQEYIINAIATIVKPKIPVFMVGDVKQSIYRFRLAEPSIFQHKYHTFQQDESIGHKIDLMRNYRSHTSVLDSTNYIFKQIMDELVGEINYDEAAQLKLGVLNEPYDAFHATEVHLIDRKQLKEDEPELDKVEFEAHHMAKSIKALVESNQLLYDRKSGEYKPITYQDIVILMRSLPSVTVFQDVFRQYEIPLFTEQNTDLFDSIEIINLISMLSIIDNPYQDIPLAGVMRSPMYFFSERELAVVKTSTRATYFYQAVLQYEHVGEDVALKQKVKAFLSQLEEFRYLARHTSLTELIRKIYEVTMYYDFVVGLPHGYLRKANLDVFYDKALAYESMSKKGVFGFVKYIERMKVLNKHFAKAKTVTANENVVRIMSIHKSKGLEFPIVFVAHIHKQFNESDEMGKYITHKKYGIAVKYIDPILRLRQKTIAQSLIAQKIHEEMLAEEMRLLYVAMTRAKSKLIFTGVFDVEKAFKKYVEVITHKEWLLPDTFRQKSKTYADFILPSVLRHCTKFDEVNPYLEQQGALLFDESQWKIKIVQAFEEAHLNLEEIEIEQKLAPSVDLNAIFNPSYDFAPLVDIKAKQSVSERKVDETTELFKGIPKPTETVVYDRPSFMKAKQNSGTEVGTAVHNFMQHLPVSTQHTLETLTSLRDELVQKEILSKEISEALDLKNILAFTQSSLYSALVDALVVKKEVPFMTLVQVDEHEQSDILLQGVLDLLAEFENEVWIVDYKTDYVKDFDAQYSELKQRYYVQMKYYSKAIAALYPTKPLKCRVYFLKVQRYIDYTLSDFDES